MALRYTPPLAATSLCAAVSCDVSARAKLTCARERLTETNHYKQLPVSRVLLAPLRPDFRSRLPASGPQSLCHYCSLTCSPLKSCCPCLVWLLCLRLMGYVTCHTLLVSDGVRVALCLRVVGAMSACRANRRCSPVHAITLAGQTGRVRVCLCVRA